MRSIFLVQLLSVAAWPSLLLVSYLQSLTSRAMMQSYGTLAFAFIALVGPVDCHHAHWLVAIVRLGQCMLFGVVVGGGHVQSERAGPSRGGGGGRKKIPGPQLSWG